MEFSIFGIKIFQVRNSVKFTSVRYTYVLPKLFVKCRLFDLCSRRSIINIVCALCNSPLFAVYLTVMISQCGNQVNNKMQSDNGIKQSPFSNSNEHDE